MQEKLYLDRARALRNAATPFEALLWRHLSGGKLDGHKFRRQHVIGSCIVDFFCPAKGLIVEVDGDTHDAAKDAHRDTRHAAMGFLTIRFSNRDVAKNLDTVLGALVERLSLTPDRWPSRTQLPHPLAPSPEGEGK